MIGLEKFICFWLLRIFGLTATYTVAPRQCKLNKFICIALGFCVYLQPELKERCRSGRTGQSRKLLNSLWVPGVRIPLSPQKGTNKRNHRAPGVRWFLFQYITPQNLKRLTSKSSRLFSQPLFMCPEQDSNLHALNGHYPLKVACLPISPSGLIGMQIYNVFLKKKLFFRNFLKFTSKFSKNVGP